MWSTRIERKQEVEVRTGKQKIEVSAEGRQGTRSWMTQYCVMRFLRSLRLIQRTQKLFCKLLCPLLKPQRKESLNYVRFEDMFENKESVYT
jgi:hypothetical protein